MTSKREGCEAGRFVTTTVATPMPLYIKGISHTLTKGTHHTPSRTQKAHTPHAYSHKRHTCTKGTITSTSQEIQLRPAATEDRILRFSSLGKAVLSLTASRSIRPTTARLNRSNRTRPVRVAVRRLSTFRYRLDS